MVELSVARGLSGENSQSRMTSPAVPGPQVSRTTNPLQGVASVASAALPTPLLSKRPNFFSITQTQESRITCGGLSSRRPGGFLEVEWVTAPAPGFGEGPRFGRRLQAQAGREVQVTAKGPIQPRSHVGFFRLTREKNRTCAVCCALACLGPCLFEEINSLFSVLGSCFQIPPSQKQ
jgi:hypothetical protein